MTGPGAGAQPLRMRVNDELVLEAGTGRWVASPEGAHYRIDPPAITLFHQVLDYLRAKPDPPRPGAGTWVGREGGTCPSSSTAGSGCSPSNARCLS